MLYVIKSRQLGRHQCDNDCTAEDNAIRDQLVIATTKENIREKAIIKMWNLAELRQKGKNYEGAAAGEEKISGCEVNKVGAYILNKELKAKKQNSPQKMLQMRFAIH